MKLAIFVKSIMATLAAALVAKPLGARACSGSGKVEGRTTRYIPVGTCQLVPARCGVIEFCADCAGPGGGVGVHVSYNGIQMQFGSCIVYNGCSYFADCV